MEMYMDNVLKNFDISYSLKGVSNIYIMFIKLFLLFYLERLHAMKIIMILAF